ncbi:MAG: ABC transporter ATP-binding protein [Chloroflexi bacterium]|nr:MAG: ABC transporter ATP-binding protein [Chloroflexota bacterium]
MHLKLTDVTVHYGKVQAVKNVSLEVDAGDIVALVGANGAGKTTLLRTISGLHPPTAGEIRFMGQRIDHLRPAQIVRLGIGHVPEGRKVFPSMTVLENLLMGAYSRRDRGSVREDVESVYQHFPVLAQRHGQLAGTLSGGEQQMLAIGRALMSKPKLMLMDEPSLGLSPIVVEHIAEIIASINKTGTAIVLVEQNVALALQLANRGYVMATGEIVLHGKSSDLMQNEEVARAFLGR